MPAESDPRRGITLVATGIEGAVGGIASANRNVRAALQTLADEAGIRLSVRILHERSRRGPFERAYGGRRVPMVLDIVRDLLRSCVVVFDHVHLAVPLVAMAMVPQRLRARTVIIAHGSESWKQVKPLSVRAFRMADLVLTNSHYTLANMRATFDGFRGEACPLGLPPQFPLTPEPPERAARRPILTAADGTRRALGARAMLLVARMDAGEREKGHRELLAVLPAVLEQVPDAELVFVGDGSDAGDILRLAVTSPAASHIFLPGRVDDALLAHLYGAAYAYVMPSRQEGFGLVHLEAMNHALPCLACHNDGAADVVVDGETGVLVRQPIDDGELIDAIVGLLSDLERARSMGIAGWCRLNAEFTAVAHRTRVAAALRPLLS